MAKKKILVVDDEKDCCDFFEDYFSKRNCPIDVAYDGPKAKELLSNNTYDFVFFDCNMPVLSGIDLIKIIDEKNPKAKKIMISGYVFISRELAIAAGVDLFLNKPLSIKDIEEAMSS